MAKGRKDCGAHSIWVEPVAKLHVEPPACICRDSEAGWFSASCRVPGHGLISLIGGWETTLDVAWAHREDSGRRGCYAMSARKDSE